LGVITISRGCFDRCCSNKKTPPYHSNPSCLEGRECRRVRVRVCECVRVRERRPQRRLACLAESRTKERETGTRNGRNGHTDNTGRGPRGDPHTHSQTLASKPAVNPESISGLGQAPETDLWSLLNFFYLSDPPF